MRNKNVNSIDHPSMGLYIAIVNKLGTNSVLLNEHNKLKNPNWQADQLAVYKWS